MMQDPRTSKQALAGLFDINGYMRDELQKKPPPAIKEQAKPLSMLEQMDQRHGKLQSRLGLFSHLYNGGTSADYGDADLLAQQKQMQTQQAMQEKMGMMQPYVDMIQDDDPANNAMGMFGISQLGGDVETMFPGMGPSQDTDIMRTTKAYVESYNDKNKDQPGFEPMTFDEGYDIVKNYDAGRRGEQTTAVETAKSDVQQFQASRDAYITAVEQDAVLTDRIANVDKGIQLLESGAVDTGPVVGYLAETFGMGSQDLAALQQMGLEEAMEALQAFKGPTTDFEFGKAELKSFAQIFKGEDLNIGTLKSARDSLEKIRKRNMLSGMSHLDAVGQYGSAEQGERLRGVFKTPESWLGETQKPEATEQQSSQVSGAPSYSQFEQDARARGITDPVMISAKYKELYGG